MTLRVPCLTACACLQHRSELCISTRSKIMIVKSCVAYDCKELCRILAENRVIVGITLEILHKFFLNYLQMNASQLTTHTSHLTPHTSHLTPHSSLLPPDTPHSTHHTKHPKPHPPPLPLSSPGTAALYPSSTSSIRGRNLNRKSVVFDTCKQTKLKL